MERLTGTPIDSRFENWERCPYDEEEFGISLKRLHSINPSGFGPIDDYGNTIFKKWNEFLLDTALSALKTCIARNSIDILLFDKLLRDNGISSF